ncbi:Hypothetical predicted protein [Lecanosticta acicola]|uniref:Uncharacterized protein n=1 Tax=Lecanosticta acicola TaxID=111012 RepID=A0AAI8Z4S5_9PEZI|nr:Hypothetical predicted protein [Lecanosticta acicola]
MAAAVATTNPQGLARWTPTLPTTLINMLNPFANPNDVPDDKQSHPQHNDPLLKRPIHSTIPIKSADAGPPSPSKSSASVMFEEPETRTNSEDDSREGSVDGRRRSKRNIRPKTRFSICHPPPESAVRSRLHRRPRSLLQLHNLSTNARPRPAFEVIPSANFSLSLTRAVTRVFKTKHGLCQNDVVVLRAEKYNSDEADNHQEQDVIGLICKGRKDEEKNVGGRPSIHMASGAVWDAMPMPNGAYEFSSTDKHGLALKVRWVPKKNKDGKIAIKRGKRRFNFSTISANTRRHPVIANLSGSGLDISDSYKIPEPAAAAPLSSPAKESVMEDAAEEEEDGSQRNETSDELREIITMTAIWVNFKEGWSPSVKYEERDTCSPAPPSRVGTGSTSVNTPPGSPAVFPADKRSSIKSIGSGIMRRTSVLSRSNRSSIVSVPEEDEPGNEVPSRSASVSKSTGRSRADSSSTVLVHRAASNRRKNNQQAIGGWRPDHLLTTQDPLQETSREDLSRDFSSTPPRKAASSLLAAAAAHAGFGANPETASGRNSDEEGSGSGSEGATRRTPTQAPPRQRSSRPPEEVTTTPIIKPVHKEASRTASETTNGSSSAVASPGGRAVPSRNQSGKTKKRRSLGLRRLLCGGGRHGDV